MGEPRSGAQRGLPGSPLQPLLTAQPTTLEASSPPPRHQSPGASFPGERCSGACLTAGSAGQACACNIPGSASRTLPPRLTASCQCDLSERGAGRRRAVVAHCRAFPP